MRWTPRLELGTPAISDDDLPLAETHLWGTLRTADGAVVCPVRSIVHGAPAPGRRLMVNRSDGQSGGLRLLPVGGTTARGAPSERSHDGSTEHLASEVGADGSPWTMTLTPDRIHWTERGTLDLVAIPTGPVARWRLPGAEASGTQWSDPERPRDTESIDYRLQVFVATGELLGHTVSGFVGLDRVHVPAGGAFYRTDPVARHGLLVAMFSFATTFADGTIESGAFAVGHDGFGYAVVHRTGEPSRCTTEVDAIVNRAEDGYWPERIDVDIAGQAWEWTGDPELRMVDYGPIHNPQCDGIFRRVGDHRRAVSWFAQGETVPAHGDRRRG